MKKNNYSKPSINDIQDYKKPDAKIRKKENLGYFFNKIEKMCKNIRNHIKKSGAQEKHFQKMQSYHDLIQRYLLNHCSFMSTCPHKPNCIICLYQLFPFRGTDNPLHDNRCHLQHLVQTKNTLTNESYEWRETALCETDDNVFHVFISSLGSQLRNIPHNPYVQISLMNESLPCDCFSHFFMVNVCNHMSKDLNHIIWEYIKNTLPPQYTDKIFFGLMLNYLHFRIAKYFTDISQRHFINPCYDTEQEIDKKKSDWQYHFMRKYYNNMTPNEYQLMKDFILRQDPTSPYVKFKQTPNKDFSKLITVLKEISDNNIHIIQEFAILLAKIYLGRTFLKEYKNDITISNVTLILCDNPRYLADFLKDILTISTIKHSGRTGFILGENYIGETTKLHHLTTFTITDLVKTNNLLDRIKNKILGNIVNIDSSDKMISNKNDIATLGKLFRGAPISITDSFETKFYFKSNAHYIFIRRFQESSIKKFLPPDTTCIRLSSSLWDSKYPPLEFYELFFLVTGFVEYGIQQLFSLSPTNSNTSSTAASLDFISAYCIETRDTNDVCLTKELYEKYVKYTEQVPDSYSAFSAVFKTAFPNLEYKDGKQRIDRRKSTKFGKAHSATGHGYIGLKFDEEKYTEDLQLRQTGQSLLSTSEDSDHYIEQLIDDYYPKY
ncbi:hypothetical protein QVN49_08210 [Megasphaera hexanoica]|nr:hypothetical protein [Megasphaera hexanoica]